MSGEQVNKAYRDVFKRMESFDVCPPSCPVNVIHLAKAGFFYVPRQDFAFSVTCFGCSKDVNVWRNGDVPSHQTFHEDGCSFVKQADGSQGDPNIKLPSPKPEQSKISSQPPHETSVVQHISEREDLSPSADRSDDVAEKVQLSGCVSMFSNMTLCRYGNVCEGEITSTSAPLPCAIKFARQSEQNLREERVLRKLGSHRHVISLFESGTFHEGLLLSQHYLVLEKCHELNLCQYLSSRKESVPVYDVNWGMNFSKQLLDGIEYIHSKLIMHKDLKPSNVLLSHDLSTIKIADFGSSQEVDSATSAIYCPYMFGTMGFRPPESFGGSYISLKSDIFSLGVVLYFLLSNGKSPFGPELELWDHNIQNGIIEFQQLPLPNPKSTEHLLKCMLSFDRLHRPSVHEVKNHPCWTGTEDDCEFGYFCEEEFHVVPTKEEEEDDAELIENEQKYFAVLQIIRKDKEAEKARNQGSRCQTNLRGSAALPSSSPQDNLQASVPSPSGAIGTSTESKENSKKLLQDSTQLLEKEDFQNILRDAERQLAEGDVDSAIERVEEFLSKESRSAMDVKNMADDLEGKRRYVQAMILYKISHDLHKKEGRFSPDDELYWIEGLTSDIVWIIDPLIEAGRISRKIATKIAVQFLTQFLDEIRKVKNASPDRKAKIESHCLSRIVHVHRLAGEVEECIRFGKEALSIMLQQLGQSAFCYHLSGILFQNLGDAYLDIGRYAEGERCVITAIEIYKKALDYESGEREYDIAFAKRILEKTRKKLAE